jgi:hypothetical protein
MHQLGRTAAQLEEYGQHKVDVLAQYDGMADYLLHKIFAYECVTVSVPASNGTAGEQQVVGAAARLCQ